MNFDPKRREFLKWTGVSLFLPLLANVLPEFAFGASTRKRFIGIYVPNGAYMPGAVNGNWNWNEALLPLVTKGVQSNAVIVRGLHNGFTADPHWQNTAGFLSCNKIQLGDPGIARCGKTVDQYIADLYPAPLRSIEIGGIYYYIHPLNDHPGYSNDYLNRISWQSADKFRSPIPDPTQLFAKVFTSQGGNPNLTAYLHSRKLSILDHLHKDANRLALRLPAAYRPVLTSYMDSVREVETQLSADATCTTVMSPPTGNFSNADANYIQRFQLCHQILVLAMQCGLTNAATIMYGPGVSDTMTFAEIIGGGNGHHACAHHGGDSSAINRLKQINQIQTGLLADLIVRLRDASLLRDTLVLYGSDMSDGNTHNTENLPVVLCGQGADLKFGQEVGSPANRRPLSDLHLEVLGLLGATSVTSFGEAECASTGQPTGIKI